MSSPEIRVRADVYRAIAHRAAMGRTGEAAFEALRDRVDLLSPAEAAIVGSCRGSGTIDQLAARAMEAGLSGSRAAIQQALSSLIERGALVSDAEIHAALARSNAVDAGGRSAEVRVIGVPTRDRPGALRRALDGYARDIVEHGRAIEIVIAEDGDSAEATAAAAREVGRSFGVKIRRLDRAAKMRFAQAIALAAGAPLEVVKGALVTDEPRTFAAGAGRNALLLASVDRCALQVDDDTVCALAAAPSARSGLRARSLEDPAEMWFGDVAGDLRAPVEEDRAPREATIAYAAAHEALLGHGAGALIADAMERGEAEIASASPSLLWRAANGGRVRCTQAGSRGDSAFGTMMHLLTIGEPTRGRLLASEAIYRGAITSRRLTRAAPIATITELDGCMTYAIGLDARAILPPFPATDRNEDGLFGTMLAATDPTALFGHLPWTIVHDPRDARALSFEAVFEHAGRVGVNDVIAGLASASLHEIDHRSIAAAIESLGRALFAWADLPSAELFERLSWMLARRLAGRLARIAALLRGSRRSPPFWARDLDRMADVLRERVEDPERAVPYDVPSGPSPPLARGLTVRRVKAYAELLVWWPSIWEAARALHARGDVPGEVLA